MISIRICVRPLQPLLVPTEMGNARASASGSEQQSTALTLFISQLTNHLRRQGAKAHLLTMIAKLSLRLTRLHKTILCTFVAVCSIFITGCGSAKTLTLTCKERQIEIYVDGEYFGRDFVHYTVPKGQESIEVSCRDNGLEVLNRRISVKNLAGSLIELEIPKHYRYSSKPY